MIISGVRIFHLSYSEIGNEMLVAIVHEMQYARTHTHTLACCLDISQTPEQFADVKASGPPSLRDSPADAEGSGTPSAAPDSGSDAKSLCGGASLLPYLWRPGSTQPARVAQAAAPGPPEI